MKKAIIGFFYDKKLPIPIKDISTNKYKRELKTKIPILSSIPLTESGNGKDESMSLPKKN